LKHPYNNIETMLYINSFPLTLCQLSLEWLIFLMDPGWSLLISLWERQILHLIWQSTYIVWCFKSVKSATFFFFKESNTIQQGHITFIKQ